VSLRFLHFTTAGLILAGGCLGYAKPLPTDLADAVREGYQSSDPGILAQTAIVIEAQLKVDPDDNELRGTLAMLYLDRLKDPAKALPHLEKVASASPRDSAWQQSLARAYRATGKADKAAEHFRKAAEIQPGDAWARYELGNTLAASSNYRGAVAAYREALKLDPKNTEVRLALAKTLWADGARDEAQEVARTVLEYGECRCAETSDCGCAARRKAAGSGDGAS
jgi:tetratricopeptide (TPR) repeat protein